MANSADHTTSKLTIWICVLVLIGLCAVVFVNSRDSGLADVGDSGLPDAGDSGLPDAGDSGLPDVSDTVRDLQTNAIADDGADWGHWGTSPNEYTGWTSHSNRLIPIFTFGISLEKYKNENSLYRDADRVANLYRRTPAGTVHESANYLDQTDVFGLQKEAVKQGKKYIFLIVFDGMDWQTTQAAAIYRDCAVSYSEGRGSTLAFQNYDKTETDFGYFVCSPHDDATKTDVNLQVITEPAERNFGGYNPQLGGFTPWETPTSYPYLIHEDGNFPHAYTDSASSATSMTSGIKTYNGAINVDPNGQHSIPIARQLQRTGFAVGAVSSVPFCHATPASAYANNVSRDDYQDLARDMLGIPSIANPDGLSGLDVVIGCGWGVTPNTKTKFKDAIKGQGNNFAMGNRYLADEDLNRINVDHGGLYQVAVRNAEMSGNDNLEVATAKAVAGNHRLFGFFGTSEGHLPYATADGDFEPTKGESEHEIYTRQDLSENPTLKDMTESAIKVLEKRETGFWLLVEAGDVDWANHENNIDDSIGAVFSGEAAFESITDWIERNNCWDESAVIVTADHGHLLVLEQPAALIPLGRQPTE